MSDRWNPETNLVFKALIRAVGTINGLPEQQQERSDRENMLSIVSAMVEGEFPVEGKSVTGRDGFIVCKALGYAIVTEHEDKEDLKQLLENLTKGPLGANYYIDNARSHVYGMAFHDETKH